MGCADPQKPTSRKLRARFARLHVSMVCMRIDDEVLIPYNRKLLQNSQKWVNQSIARVVI